MTADDSRLCSQKCSQLSSIPSAALVAYMMAQVWDGPGFWEHTTGYSPSYKGALRQATLQKQTNKMLEDGNTPDPREETL